MYETKIEMLHRLANGDSEYRAMKQVFITQEKRFLETACDYLSF